MGNLGWHETVLLEKLETMWILIITNLKLHLTNVERLFNCSIMINIILLEKISLWMLAYIP